MLRSAVPLVALFLIAPAAEAQNLPQWKHAADFASQQLQKTAASIPVNETPQATDKSGQWGLVANTNLPGWTQGFFPGCLWYRYEETGDVAWRDLATKWTDALAVQETNTTTHDLGFKLFPSFGHGYELTAEDAWHQAVLTGATSLATRYRANPGIISMGDWNPAWKMPIVIDTMMNLELLVWAARNGGDPAWEDMAISHATITLRDLVRADGSTYGAADYDPTTGQLRWLGTLQGSSNTSTWARGQTWAMYGFARMYQYTGRPEFLDASRRTTALFLSRLPADSIPPWDFDSPDQQKDSSSAAIAAAALLELAAVETDATAAAQDRAFAIKLLDILSGPDYLAEGTNSQGVLLHGVGNYLENLGVNASLIYGDYYFLEALLRAQYPGLTTDAGTVKVPNGPLVPPATPDAGTPPPSGSPTPTPTEPSPTPTTGSTQSPALKKPSAAAESPTGCASSGMPASLIGLMFAFRSRRRRSTLLYVRRLVMRVAVGLRTTRTRTTAPHR
jgi:unsaturated chondroitin disaccharide hydrolase